MLQCYSPLPGQCARFRIAGSVSSRRSYLDPLTFFRSEDLQGMSRMCRSSQMRQMPQTIKHRWPMRGLGVVM